MFRRLAVFVGGFTLAAAEGVMGDGFLVSGMEPNAPPMGPDTRHTSPVTLGLLAALVDKSLVRQASDAAGEPRFTMLETIREFAVEQLESHDDEEEIRGAHARFFVKLAESAATGLWGSEQPLWIDRLLVDLDNLRAALSWSLETPVEDSERTEIGMRLVVAL
jgi:predicted ATPase